MVSLTGQYEIMYGENHFLQSFVLEESKQRGVVGGAMVLGKLPEPERPTILMIVGQGPTPLVVGAGWGCLDIFTLIYLFSPLSSSLWETVRYRLKYCLKGPLNLKRLNNQPKKATDCHKRCPVFVKKAEICRCMQTSIVPTLLRPITLPYV